MLNCIASTVLSVLSNRITINGPAVPKESIVPPIVLPLRFRRPEFERTAHQISATDRLQATVAVTSLVAH